MHRFSLLLITWLLVNACCDRHARRIQPFWLRVPDPYSLSLEAAERVHEHSVLEQIRFQPIRDQRGNCADETEMLVCISNVNYGFWLDVTNKAGNPIRLLWPETRYVDEAGKPHEVYAQERGALPDERDKLKLPPPQPVNPGQRVRPTVVPIYKQYMVASGCSNLYPYSEPLIPSRLGDKNEQQMKAYVDDLAKRHVPVKLVLPIEIDGARYDYTFTFVLKDRWANLPKQ